MKKSIVLAGIAGLALASSAMGQFIATGAGPYNSDGSSGSAANGIFTFEYAGPDFQIGNILFSGTVTSVFSNTWLSELRFSVTTPSGVTFDSGQLTSGSSWSGSQFITATPQDASSLGLGTAGTWTFRFWENYDDAGVDAIWTDIAFEVQPGYGPPPTFPGSFTGTPNQIFAGVPVTGTTVWDGANPQPGLTRGAGEQATTGRYGTFGWDLVGNEVAYRFEHGGGDIEALLTDLTSDLDMVLIDSTGLVSNVLAVSNGSAGTGDETILLADAAPGTYYVVVDTFSPTNPGSSFTLTVVPAPGAMALLGLSGLLAGRRRR